LLDTVFIQNQSRTWQGIVHGLELLKKGIWRIGSGSSVKIYRDNWLPRTGALHVDGKRGNSRRKWVSELIDHNTGTWNESVVRECYFPHDASVILSIKLSPRPVNDFLAWSGEHNGLFSVRSAYRIGIQPKLLELSGGQSSSDPTGDRKVWDLIWKLNVPPKLRVFAWRAASDSLGVRLNLSKRVHTITPICTICGHASEDAHHAIVSYTLARALREELRAHWSLPDEVAFRGSNKEWLFLLLGNAAKDQRPKIIFLLWRVWHHRNNFVHGDGRRRFQRQSLTWSIIIVRLLMQNR
jgi:hypothetical protein